MNNKIERRTAFNKLFFMFMMFMWCTSTTPYLKIISAEVPYFALAHFSILFYYYSQYCKKVNHKPLLTLFGVISLWWFLQCVKRGMVVGMDVNLISHSVVVFIAYHVFNGKEFFIYYEKVLVFLTILSLLVWGFELIIPSTTDAIMKSISIWDNGSTTYANIGIVGLGHQQAVGMGIFRNIGFTWEAGRFSGFLVVGLFVILLVRNLKIDFHNRPFWILTIALITTFSTTGYGAGLAVILFYFYNKSTKYKLSIIIFSILLLPSLWGLSFFSEKILEESNVTQGLVDMQNAFRAGRDSITPGRIVGAYLEFQNLIHDFWLGYDLNELSYTNTEIFGGEEVWISNGVLMILAKYGIFVGAFFYYLLFKSSKMIIKDFCFHGKYSYALIFILISISYDYWGCCVLLYFVYYCLYVQSTCKRKSNHYVR